MGEDYIMYEYLAAVIIGIVQGLTEFLPVSSTGHMIIVGNLIGFTGKVADLFDVFIQLGSILAVLILTSRELNSYGNPEPFEQIIGKQSYAYYLKYKNIISAYVRTAELPNWAHLNPDRDGYEGTSTIALYEYLKSQE